MTDEKPRKRRPIGISSAAPHRQNPKTWDRAEPYRRPLWNGPASRCSGCSGPPSWRLTAKAGRPVSVRKSRLYCSTCAEKLPAALRPEVGLD